MMASILGHLKGLADKHPDKLLYSYLEINGESLESYTYASFLNRAQAIAGQLLKGGRFAPGDRLLLAYPPGLEMICAFFGCVRAGLIPVPGLSAEFARVPERLVQNGSHCEGLPGGWHSHEPRLSRVPADEPRPERCCDIRCGRGVHLRPALDLDGRLCQCESGSAACQADVQYPVSPVHVRFNDGAQGRHRLA